MNYDNYYEHMAEHTARTLEHEAQNMAAKREAYYIGHLKRLGEQMRETHTRHTEFLHRYLVLETTFFAALIAFGSNSNYLVYYQYKAALLLLALSLLLGLFAATLELHLRTRWNLRYKENIQAAQQNKTQVDTPIVNPPLYFRVLEVSGYACFSLCVVCFAWWFICI